MREPLDSAVLTALLPGRAVTVLLETGSTNADLRAAAVSGQAQPGHLVVAEFQRSGRGRLDRSWDSPAGAGLTFSVLVDPGSVAVERWGWLPLLTGLAVAEAARAVAGVEARVKWPNDVLADGRKVAGVLCERVDVGARGLAIVGVGLNVDTSAEELPVPHATSLALAGGTDLNRGTLLAGILQRLDTRVGAWRDAGGDAATAGLADLYLAASATLGRDTTVAVPGGESVQGHALRVDASGALVLRTVDGERTVAAGDLVWGDCAERGTSEDRRPSGQG
ncbi:MAG: biotin--[acetyl-CoA-carboxylase] ligase [Sporichthyaceae bacterium]